MEKKQSFIDALKQGMVLFLLSIFLPYGLTMILSGSSLDKIPPESGITIIYENGEKTDMEEFLIYMLAGQADPEWEKEALKAQAVIARTNLMREIEDKKEVNVGELSVVYVTPEKFEASYGEVKRQEIRKKYEAAVRATYSRTIRYESEYIEALYHQVSPGNTLSAQEVFGTGRPYLISVESSRDIESEEYMTLKTYSAKEVLETLKKNGKGTNLSVDTVLSSLKIEDKTENGYIKTLLAGKERISGEDWKNYFAISSCCFYLEEQEGSLRMITLGKGHGVGLSQYGANALAKEGWGFEKILKKYYPDTDIV